MGGRRRVVGRTLVAIGVVGALTAALGTVVALRLLGALDDVLDATLGVTMDASAALADTVALADATVADVEATLRSASTATRGLGRNLDEAQALLEGAAEVTRDDVAGSLAAVEQALPALVDVAGVVDGTLRGLSRLPFGPSYDPAAPFDDSLRELQAELEGLPGTIREQADLVAASAGDLASVADDAGTVADDLRGLADTLGGATDLLDEYAGRAEEADAQLTDTSDALRTQLRTGRALVVVLGLSVLGGQLVPIGIGWFLLDPDRVRTLLSAADGTTTST